MRRNLVTRGKSRDPDGTAVAWQRHAVHGRGGRPCPRCGALIRIRAQGQQARLTYFCPRCQGEPSESSARRRGLRP
jgi:formamidopyrimidine-DNA glycosylase